MFSLEIFGAFLKGLENCLTLQHHIIIFIKNYMLVNSSKTLLLQ